MSGSNRLCAACAFALALACALPAGAAVRTARFAWSPAPGPVAGYAVYTSVDGGSEQLYDWVATTSAEIEVASSASLSVRVAAFDTSGVQGPRSDPSSELRLCPGDFNGDETIGGGDMLKARACIGRPATSACAAADLNFDDVVNASDYALLSLGAAACPPSPGAACAGDFDGNGIIDALEYVAVRSCLGLLAEGRCALADMDGNGFIGSLDATLARNAIGMQACSY